MRCVRLMALALIMASCSEMKDGYRYREISNPHPECGATPEPGCGIAILDTQTGTVYVRDSLGWWEEHPQTGKIIQHKLDYLLEPQRK